MYDNAIDFFVANKEIEALQRLLNVQHVMVKKRLKYEIEFRFTLPLTGLLDDAT